MVARARRHKDWGAAARDPYGVMGEEGQCHLRSRQTIRREANRATKAILPPHSGASPGPEVRVPTFPPSGAAIRTSLRDPPVTSSGWVVTLFSGSEAPRFLPLDCAPWHGWWRLPTRRVASPRRRRSTPLGFALAELGRRVLLVDLDPQACLTYLGRHRPRRPRTIRCTTCSSAR